MDILRNVTELTSVDFYCDREGELYGKIFGRFVPLSYGECQRLTSELLNNRKAYVTGVMYLDKIEQPLKLFTANKNGIKTTANYWRKPVF